MMHLSTTRFMAAISVMSCVAMVGCSRTPRVTVAALQDGGVLQFEMNGRGYNSLHAIEVWAVQTREPLWAVNLSSFKSGRISYGFSGRGVSATSKQEFAATQIFPKAKQRARPLSPNTKYYLSVICQYDQWYAASSKSFDFSFTTDSSGKVSELSPITTLRPDDRVYFPATSSTEE